MEIYRLLKNVHIAYATLLLLPKKKERLGVFIDWQGIVLQVSPVTCGNTKLHSDLLVQHERTTQEFMGNGIVNKFVFKVCLPVNHFCPLARVKLKFCY